MCLTPSPENRVCSQETINLIAKYFYQNKMIWYGLGAGIIFWILESVIHSQILAENNFIRELLYPGTTESLLRVVVIGFLLSLGTYAQKNLQSRTLAEKMTALASRELDQIFNASVDSMCLIGGDYRIFRINTCYSFLAETTDASARGKKCSDVFRHSLCDTPGCPLPMLLNGVQLVETDVVKEYPDGSTRHFIMTATPFRGPEGKVTGIIEQYKDITDRKRAEETLRESEKRFRALFEYAPDAYYLHDFDGTFIDGNKAAEELVGYKRDELIGNSFFDLHLLSPDDLSRAAAALELNKKGHNTKSAEYLLRRSDGVTIPVEISAYPIRIDGENMVLGIARDVSERKRAEEALRKSEEKYRILVENAQEGIWAIDAKAYTTYVNEFMANMLGYTVNEMIGKHLFAFIDEKTRKTAEMNLERRRKGIKEEHDFEFVRKDGKKIYTRLETTPLTDGNGMYSGALACVSDITEQKQAEDALRESEERYRKLVDLSPDAITVHTEGKISFINKSGARLLGADDPSQIFGRPIVDFIHPDYRETIAKRVRNMSERNKYVPFIEEKFIKVDGSPVDVEAAAVSMIYQGKPSIMAIAHDVSERKQTEKAMKESEKRYRLLAENAGDVIWTMDLNLQFTYLSPSILNLRGITPEMAMRETLVESLTPQSYKYGMEAFQRELSRENDPDFDPRRSITIELEMYRRDGSTVWTENTLSPIRDENGKLVEILGVTRDISDRKNTEIFLNRQRDLGLALSSARDLHEALQLYLKTAIYLSGLDSGGIYLVDQETGGLVLACSEGLSRQFVESVSYYSANSPNVLLVMEGRPVYLIHQDLDLPLLDTEIHERLQAMAVIPILHENNVIACINVASHVMKEIPQRERYVLETITAYIGSTIARLQIEDTLRRSEERFRCLVQNSQDLIFSIDSEMAIQYVSPSVERTLRYPAEAIIGKSLLEYINQEDSEGLQTVLSFALENSHTPFPVEFRLRSRDFSWIFSEGTANNLLNQPGVEGIVINIHDASERRRAEEMLRGAAEQWRETFDSMSDAVMLINRDHRIIRANQAASELLGLSFSKLLGRNCHECVHKTDMPPTGCLHDKTILDGKPYSDERYIPWMDKSFYVTTSPLFDERQKLAGTVHVMRDITDRKKLETRLMHSERLAAVGGIAAGIAHEIKNPIFAISSGIQILESELELDREQRETFKIIFNETMRVDGLIRQLTEYGAKSDLRRSLHKLDLLINEVIYLNRGLLHAKGVTIETELPEKLPAVSIDRNKITQVMLNLIQNAIDASRKEDVINIRVRHDTSINSIIVTVKDKGPGIPVELHGKIFDPFFSTKKDNLGMGLAISKKIIMDHGGEISVDTTDGRGTTFRVELPLEQEEEEYA